MKFLSQLSYFFVAILFCASCTRREMNQPSFSPQTVEWIGDNSRNLNIVYFVPNDLDTLQGYETRLSELMLWAQNWVEKEMDRNGYGKKTFGLIKDQTGKKVKIITLKAEGDKSKYSYTGGAGVILKEINKYFEANPKEKSGEHALIILPRYTASPISGGPFFGWGRSCFALDHENQDIKFLGTDTHEFTKWFGGMIHELGHGLNLPHNRQKSSENSLGMALMWGGNYTLGKSATHLTQADAAVLNVNEIFNKDNKVYYGAVKADITRIYGTYDATKQALIVKGKFTSAVKVTDVLYFNDPNVNNEGVGVNKDYNAIAWVSKPLENDSFYVEMPISDLVEKVNMEYELKIKLVCENGVVKEFNYDYTFINGIPDLTLPYQSPGWNITDFSSEETANEDGKAINAIDGNPSTYWHSRWSANPTHYPHALTIDTKSVVERNGIAVRQRKGLSRAIKDFEVWVKNDAGNFVKTEAYTAQNIEGKQVFNFGKTIKARKFKIIFLNAHDGDKYASIGEIQFL